MWLTKAALIALLSCQTLFSFNRFLTNLGATVASTQTSKQSKMRPADLLNLLSNSQLLLFCQVVPFIEKGWCVCRPVSLFQLTGLNRQWIHKDDFIVCFWIGLLTLSFQMDDFDQAGARHIGSRPKITEGSIKTSYFQHNPWIISAAARLLPLFFFFHLPLSACRLRLLNAIFSHQADVSD